MGSYVGVITIRNNYVNFKPLYEYDYRELHYLTSYDRKEILPESLYGDINFYFGDGKIKASEYFVDGEYCLFEFELEDLEDNYNSYEERNPTGYKVDVTRYLDDGSIRPLSEISFYYVLPLNSIDGNYKTTSILYINDSFVYGSLEVIIPLDDHENTVLGPFVVEHRDNQFFINTKLKEQNYLIKGIKYPQDIREYEKELGKYEDEKRVFVEVDDSCKEILVDVITKQQLLDDFKRTVGEENFENGKLDLSDTDRLIKSYEKSLFVGDNIPKEIQQNRFDALSEMLSDEDNLNDTFSSINEVIIGLLEKYQGKNAYNEIIRNLIENPEFLPRIQRFKLIQDRIAIEEERVRELEAKKLQLEDEIKNKENENKNSEYAEGLIDGYEDEIQAKKDELSAVDSAIIVAKETLGIFTEGIELKKVLSEIDEKVKYKEQRERELDSKLKVIETKIDSVFDNSTEKAMNFAFDGMLSSRMMKQAAEWENEQDAISYSEKLKQLCQIPQSTLIGNDLIEYLVKRIKTIRPKYDKNTIINILICYTQNFLTVFSGEPGVGKTSICNILNATLGLNDISKTIPEYGDGFDPNRYISVSVERGWTTKRDFVGYFNPLTKTFDRSNRKIFDALNILHYEAKNTSSGIPFTILLDEANLSPMEYYWADFMQICDKTDGTGSINLGNDYRFYIPENLRFVATINNDHTTEALSPRLIDRAWIVKLPLVAPSTKSDSEYMEESFEVISWLALKETFNVTSAEVEEMSGSTQDVYDSFVKEIRAANITFSPRTESAVKRYWTVAHKLFDNDAGYVDSSIVALDYAFSQRVLPHIDGSGENFGTKLKDLAKICTDNNLRLSAGIINDIVKKGENNMHYYQYFA